MSIRPATAADAALLTRLSVTTLHEAFGPPLNTTELVDEYIRSAISEPILAAELADPRSCFFVLETQQGLPIGFAKLRRHAPPRRMAERRAIEIQRLYLLQAHIGQGQGRLLMNHCLDWARNQGYRAVWLGVWERNQRALAFYRKIGFTQFGFHYFWFGSERQRDFWLQKQLTD